jgi:predicted transcriptional regulator
MSLPQNKREILETMLITDKPAKATEIAKETCRDFKPVMMHILGLIRMGYVNTPEKGLYTITERGKQALGLIQPTKETAKALLGQFPGNKAFHFYTEIGKPVGINANSLQDFASKLQKAGPASMEFHSHRGDFESWFTGVGDLELAKKASLLKERKLLGSDLSSKLQQLVENRLRALAVLAC